MIVTCYIEYPPMGEEFQRHIVRMVVKELAESAEAFCASLVTRFRRSYPEASIQFGPVSETGFGR